MMNCTNNWSSAHSAGDQLYISQGQLHMDTIWCCADNPSGYFANETCKTKVPARMFTSTHSCVYCTSRLSQDSFTNPTQLQIITSTHALRGYYTVTRIGPKQSAPADTGSDPAPAGTYLAAFSAAESGRNLCGRQDVSLICNPWYSVIKYHDLVYWQK